LEDAQRLMPVDEAELTALLAWGRSRRDSDGSVFENLGFSAGLWNNAEPPADLHVSAGGWTVRVPAWHMATLSFPGPDAAGVLYVPGVASAIMAAAVSAWEPDWASWRNNTLHEAQSPPPRVPVVGWLTYLSAGRLANGLDGLRWEPMGSGALVWAGETFDQVDGPAVVRVRDRLKEVGALEPIP
jgi:hypothetical protein